METAHIQSVISTPEAISYTFNGRIGVDKFDFGFAFTSADEIESIIPPILKNYVNQIVVQTNENHDEALTAIKNKLANSNIAVIDAFTREQGPDIIFIENVYKQMRIISFVVPVIFLTITLVLIFLFLLQIIRGFMHEIGIMHALGIKKKKILGLMSVFSLTMSISSSLVGIAGSFGLTYFLSNTYTTNYSIPNVNPFPNLSIAIIVSAIMIALGLIASFVTMFIIRHVTPTDAILNNANQYKPLPEKINRLIDKRSTNFKINVNSIHKNFLRFLVSVVAVTFSYAIIFGAMHFYCANERMPQQYLDRCNYDAEIYSLNIIPASDKVQRKYFFDQVRKLPSVTKLEEILTTSVKINFNNQEEDIVLVGVHNERSLINIPDANANGTTNIKPNEIVIESELASRFNIHVNDEVMVNGLPLKVNAISKQLMIKYHYVEYNTFLDYLKPVNTFDIAVSKVTNQNALLTDLTNIELSTHTVFVDKQLLSATAGIRATEIAAISIVGFSFLIGFLVIFIMNQDSLHAQKRKLSILSALGFKRKRIAKIILYQQLTSSIIGLALGVPAGIYFAKFLAKVGSSRTITNIFLNYWWIYLLAFMAIVIYILVVQLASYLMIKKWKISENIKTRE